MTHDFNAPKVHYLSPRTGRITGGCDKKSWAGGLESDTDPLKTTCDGCRATTAYKKALERLRSD